MLIIPTPRCLVYGWCVWSWRLMHNNLFVYWSVCDVTILRCSFHVDNSNAKMVGLCLIWYVWSLRLMHDNLFVYWSVCDVTILCSSFHVNNSNAKMVWVMLDTYDHKRWCMTIFSSLDRCVMYTSFVALSMLITPTSRWLGYAWCVRLWRLMHDNLFLVLIGVWCNHLA